MFFRSIYKTVFSVLKKSIPRVSSHSLQSKHLQPRRPHGTPANQGFTLIEALVALIVIVLIATAALETQMTTLKLEQAARDTQALRFAIPQTLSASRIIPTETLLAGMPSTNGPIRIQVTALTLPGQPAPTQWLKWELCSVARPALKAEVFTRPNEP